jgi:hypothetical protein
MHHIREVIMNISDWVLVGTTLFLGIIALIVPALSEIIKKELFAPKLDILFEMTPPYCIKTFWRSPVEKTLNEPVHYYRIQVVNNGKSQARKCEVVLEEFWIYDASGKPHRVEKFTTVYLPIEGGTPTLDINPNRKVFCAIGHISSPKYQKGDEKGKFIDIPGNIKKTNRFLFDLNLYPFGQPNCIVAGKYLIKVSIYSENAAHIQRYYSISWSGRWQENENEMLRELVIQKVTSP